jgi:hypothetical protein
MPAIEFNSTTTIAACCKGAAEYHLPDQTRDHPTEGNPTQACETTEVKKKIGTTEKSSEVSPSLHLLRKIVDLVRNRREKSTETSK